MTRQVAALRGLRECKGEIGGNFMPRKSIDCRDYPSDTKCSLKLSGEEEEVVRAAAEHSISVHGMEDTSELRSEIRKGLKDESFESEEESRKSESSQAA